MKSIQMTAMKRLYFCDGNATMAAKHSHMNLNMQQYVSNTSKLVRLLYTLSKECVWEAKQWEPSNSECKVSLISACCIKNVFKINTQYAVVHNKTTRGR